MNEPTWVWSSELGPDSVGVLLLWPPAVTVARLMAVAPEVCLRKQLLILPSSLLVFPTDRLGLSSAPNWTVKTHWAMWYINVDTDRPRDSLPISLYCCLGALMKICGHFRVLPLTSLFIAMLWSLRKMSNVSDDKGCCNSIFCKTENV